MTTQPNKPTAEKENNNNSLLQKLIAFGKHASQSLIHGQKRKRINPLCGQEAPLEGLLELQDEPAEVREEIPENIEARQRKFSKSKSDDDDGCTGLVSGSMAAKTQLPDDIKRMIDDAIQRRSEEELSEELAHKLSEKLVETLAEELAEELPAGLPEEFERAFAKEFVEGFIKGYVEGFEEGFEKGMLLQREYEKELIRKDIGFRLASMKLMSIVRFEKRFDVLSSLGTAPLVGTAFPAYGLVYATYAVKHKRDTRQSITIPPPHESNSGWSVCAPACQPQVEKDVSDLNYSNMNTICQCIERYNEIEGMETSIHRLGPSKVTWPEVHGQNIDLWDELGNSIKSQTNLLIEDINSFLRVLYPGARLTRHTKYAAVDNGYDFLNNKNPIPTDAGVALKYNLPGGEEEKYIYLICEEYKALEMGVGKAILEKYKDFHDCDIESVNEELNTFYKKNGLATPIADNKTLFLVTDQAIVQACALHCRNFVISDGSVYMILHVSKNQNIDEVWPLDKKYLHITQMDPVKEFTFAKAEQFESTPLRVDKISIVTNDTGSIVGAHGAVMCNELVRCLPMIKEACDVFLEEGLTAAKRYAEQHPLVPNKEYLREVDHFWERFREICRRRLASVALEVTEQAATLPASLLKIEAVLRDRSSNNPYRHPGGPSIYQIKWNDNTYILKVYPFDFDGLQRYSGEWYSYHLASSSNLSIMVKMVLHGRLNEYQNPLDPGSGGSVDSGQTLVNQEAEPDAPFFTLTEVALGDPADFNNSSHMSLVNSALKTLDKAGISLPYKEEKNFYIYNGNIKVIGFGGWFW